MLTPQVASSLGISVSTINKHLASVRRKLGVTRTSHALLLEAEGRLACRQRHDAGDTSSQLCDFVIALETCHTFDEAWNLLRDHTDRLGVIANVCGVSADPPGLVTNGVRAIRRLWPEQIVDMYYAMGGEQADPTVALAVRQTNSFVVDTERLLIAIRSEAPKPVIKFGEALMDTDFRYQIHQPGRDRITRAPLMTTYSVPLHAINDFRRNSARIKEAVRCMADAFWDFVQSRRLMASSIAGLTRRQTEVLTFAARGFTVSETADHIGVSLSSAEKTLAAARKQLGARTTTSAVYRALVYRVFT